MKLTKSKLKQIIREELDVLLKEESKVQVDIGLPANWKAGADTGELITVLKNHLRGFSAAGGERWATKLAPEKLDAFRTLIKTHIRQMSKFGGSEREKEEVRELFFEILKLYGMDTEEFRPHSGHSDPTKMGRNAPKKDISREEASHLARQARQRSRKSERDMWGDMTYGKGPQR